MMRRRPSPDPKSRRKPWARTRTWGPLQARTSVHLQCLQVGHLGLHQPFDHCHQLCLCIVTATVNVFQVIFLLVNFAINFLGLAGLYNNCHDYIQLAAWWQWISVPVSLFFVWQIVSMGAATLITFLTIWIPAPTPPSLPLETSWQASHCPPKPYHLWLLLPLCHRSRLLCL